MISDLRKRQFTRRSAILAAASAVVLPGLAIGMRQATAAMPAQTQFQVFRNGSEVGYHRFDVQESDGRTEISIDILLEVGLGPIVLYRYIHQNREVYENGQFVSFTSETDDDGDEYTVSAERVGDTIQVSSSLNGSFEADALNTVPTTWWNARTTDASQLLDTQEGRILDVTITPADWETVSVPESEVEAHRYEIDGDLTLTLWYDRDDRLVKLYFPLGGADFDYNLV